MSAGIVLHRGTQRAVTDVPAGVGVIVAYIKVAGTVGIDLAHLCLFTQVIAASVAQLRYLGAVAVLVP